MKELILYSALGSNSSERVEWVLNFKAIPYQRVEVDGSELNASFLDINPFGYVPTLSIDGLVISESMAIAECIEELCSSPALLGDNWKERASIREICEYVNSTIHSPQNRTVLSAFRPDLVEDTKKKLRGKWITEKLIVLIGKLWKDSEFAVGNSFSLADIFVVTIYKKALQHGAKPISQFESYLEWLLTVEKIASSEPYGHFSLHLDYILKVLKFKF